jgi:type IV secretory pathway TraG/TraD family ATPase VirD4
MLLMAQDLASISATYGTETSSAIWSNCRTKLLLPGISEPELLERVSKLAGSATLHGGPGRHGEPIGSHPVLAPDEVRRLRSDRALVIHGGDHPAVVQQRRWYQDQRLRRLVGAQLAEDQVPRPVRGRPLTEWERDPSGDIAEPLPWAAGLELRPAVVAGGVQ